MLHFAVRQKCKLRFCGYARSSLSHDGTSTFEKICCKRADLPVRVARQFASDFDAPAGSSYERALKAGTDGLANAYRHVPCADLRCLLLLGRRGSRAWLGRTKNLVDYLIMALFNFGMLTQSPASIAFRKRLVQWPGSSSMRPVPTSL